ncbi:MAG: hypothetical protein EXS14_06565 [Planctomycetes bacterium]|nr:hypothetical protein [Planctomycetota bacterium]
MTEALGVALRKRLLGIFDFARIAAFRAPAGSANEGCALVFFIEPRGTRLTVEGAMEALLRDPGMSQGLLEDIQAALTPIASHPDSKAFKALRAEARFTMGDHRDFLDDGGRVPRFNEELQQAQKLIADTNSALRASRE